MKRCSKCGVGKEDDEFTKNQVWCRTCVKEYNKKYQQNNKETIKEYKKEYRKNNKESAKKSRNKYKTKFSTDPYFKFTRNLRRRISCAFKLQSKNGKTQSCSEYGIDFAAIYAHIGQKPKGNYHLDHIIPLSVFNLDNPEHVRLSHLPENLRWLPGLENLSKSDSIDMEIIGCSLKLLAIAKHIGLI